MKEVRSKEVHGMDHLRGINFNRLDSPGLTADNVCV